MRTHFKKEAKTEFSACLACPIPIETHTHENIYILKKQVSVHSRLTSSYSSLFFKGLSNESRRENKLPASFADQTAATGWPNDNLQPAVDHQAKVSGPC